MGVGQVLAHPFAEEGFLCYVSVLHLPELCKATRTIGENGQGRICTPGQDLMPQNRRFHPNPYLTPMGSTNNPSTDPQRRPTTAEPGAFAPRLLVVVTLAPYSILHMRQHTWFSAQ